MVGEKAPDRGVIRHGVSDLRVALLAHLVIRRITLRSAGLRLSAHKQLSVLGRSGYPYSSSFSRHTAQMMSKPFSWSSFSLSSSSSSSALVSMAHWTNSTHSSRGSTRQKHGS